MGEETEDVPNYKSVDELMHAKTVPTPFLLDDQNEYIVQKNIISDNGTRCGVVLPLDLLPAGLRERVQAKAKRLVICGADDQSNSLNDNSRDRSKEEFPAPSMSFECLSRLLDHKANSTAAIERAYDAVATGRVQIADFLPDQTKKLSAADKKKYKSEKKRKTLVPPAPGYTLVGSEWHRAATVLLIDTKTSTHYMMGQDEDQYFGVQLAGKPNTVAEAFVDLTPKEAQGVGGVQRQGEWFVVPISDKNLPAPFGAITNMVLPKEDPESNDHSLSADEIRIRDNQIYAIGIELEHEQHGSLTVGSMSGWNKIVRNTAIRSVSVEGVD